MDLVSIPHNSFLKKKNVINGFGHKNGFHNHKLANGHGNGNINFGHSDFMKIQRYENLIGKIRIKLSADKQCF